MEKQEQENFQFVLNGREVKIKELLGNSNLVVNYQKYFLRMCLQQEKRSSLFIIGLKEEFYESFEKEAKNKIKKLCYLSFLGLQEEINNCFEHICPQYRYFLVESGAPIILKSENIPFICIALSQSIYRYMDSSDSRGVQKIPLELVTFFSILVSDKIKFKINKNFKSKYFFTI